MKWFLFILLPLSAIAQPAKGVFYSKKKAHSVQDGMVIWKKEESTNSGFFIGKRTLTLGKEQYSIDSMQKQIKENAPLYSYFLSSRSKPLRCFIYPSGLPREWILLLDDNSSLILYRLRE